MLYTEVDAEETSWASCTQHFGVAYSVAGGTRMNKTESLLLNLTIQYFGAVLHSTFCSTFFLLLDIILYLAYRMRQAFWKYAMIMSRFGKTIRTASGNQENKGHGEEEICPKSPWVSDQEQTHLTHSPLPVKISILLILVNVSGYKQTIFDTKPACGCVGFRLHWWRVNIVAPLSILLSVGFSQENSESWPKCLDPYHSLRREFLALYFNLAQSLLFYLFGEWTKR